METPKSRMLQDNRRQSRFFVNMKCRLACNDMEYEALLLDLSQRGTLLCSTFLMSDKGIPDIGNKISIAIDADEGKMLTVPLTLKGTIRRSNIGITGLGKVAKLGIEFEEPPLALVRLISALSKRN